MKAFPEVDKSWIAEYLTHSTVTAEWHYRMKQGSQLQKAVSLITRLGSDASDSGEELASTFAAAASCSGSRAGPKKLTFKQLLDQFLELHPVTLNGDVASLAERAAVSAEPEHIRRFHERWFKLQRKMRIKHAVAQFDRRCPAESRVASWIKSQGWVGNIPEASKVVEAWMPSRTLQDLPQSVQVRRLVSNQRWKGLKLADFGEKGTGVVAGHLFKAGEVICDYHGRVVTAEEGNAIHASTNPQETGYMFFYKNSREEDKCIDACALLLPPRQGQKS